MIKITLMRTVLAVCFLACAPVVLAAQADVESTQQSMQLDINKADAAAIAAALDGVGMVKAQEIVAYREMFGSFTSIEELLEVKGIGAATVERNRQRIIIVNN